MKIVILAGLLLTVASAAAEQIVIDEGPDFGGRGKYSISPSGAAVPGEEMLSGPPDARPRRVRNRLHPFRDRQR